MKRRINITGNMGLYAPFSSDVHFYLWGNLKHIKYISYVTMIVIYYENK